MWGEVSSDIGETRERVLSGKFFKPVLDEGAKMVRHHNTVQSAHNIVRRIVASHPVVLRIQRELVDEERELVNTTAGEALNRELNEQIKRHRTELEEVRAKMVRALREKGERQELEEERKRL